MLDSTWQAPTLRSFFKLGVSLVWNLIYLKKYKRVFFTGFFSSQAQHIGVGEVVGVNKKRPGGFSTCRHRSHDPNLALQTYAGNLGCALAKLIREVRRAGQRRGSDIALYSC